MRVRVSLRWWVFATFISTTCTAVIGLSTTALASEYRLCFDASKMEHSFDQGDRKKGTYVISWKGFEDSDDQEETVIVPLNAEVVKFLSQALKSAENNNKKQTICVTGSYQRNAAGRKTVFAFLADYSSK